VYKKDVATKLKMVDYALKNGVITPDQADQRKAQVVSDNSIQEAKYYFSRWDELKNLKRAYSNNVISKVEFDLKYLELEKNFMSRVC
jgi:hypothetical protein